jgi:hypothetical protein
MATALGLGQGVTFGGSVGQPNLNLDFASMGVNGLDPRITFTRASNATMFNSQGLLVWAPANMLISTATLSTQTVTTGMASGNQYTLSIYGTGSVTLSGGASGALNGTGASNRVSVGFTASSGTATFTVSGNVTQAQLERTGADSPKPYVENSTAPTSQYYGLRVDYDSATLAPLGLLIEEQRTNLVTQSNDFSSIDWVASGATKNPTAITAPDGTLTGCSFLPSDITTTLAKGVVNSQISVIIGRTYAASMWIKQLGTMGYVHLFLSLTGFTTTQAITLRFSDGLVTSATGTPANYTAKLHANGWWRVQFTAVCTATVATAALCVNMSPDGIWNNRAFKAETITDGIATWGAQLEEGTFATSLIPTFSAIAARANELASMPLAGWWQNNWRGTFVVAHKSFASSTSTRVWAIRVDASNLMQQSDSSGNLVIGQIASTAGGLQTIGATAYTANTVYKTAIRFDGTTLAVAVNGGAVASGASGGVPVGTPTTLALGNAGFSSAYLNGWISSLRYYPTARPDAQLQALTT